MKQTWRWFGPEDKVSISDIQQADADGIVTALHHVPNGAVWPIAEIEKRQTECQTTPNESASNLTWHVVESLPVSEEIKQQTGDWLSHIENYKQSLRNLNKCGLSIICYNFMPVLDWTRTTLAHSLPNGASCMRFDIVDFAAFDIHILRRKHATADFPPHIVQTATERFATMSESDKTKLAKNIVCGLPGAEQGYSLSDLREQIERYSTITETRLRQNQLDFLEAVVPTAEELGMRLCCHPDDPPFSLLGLPRIMSTEDDYRRLISSIESPANGITLCSGSLGVRSDVDLAGMMHRLGEKVHFIHLRNVVRETHGPKISFHESAHLDGDTCMVELIKAILKEEHRRILAGRDDSSIPFRPDHGQEILSDLHANAQPGYPAVGRLKGLAELRGIIAALSHDPSLTS